MAVVRALIDRVNGGSDDDGLSQQRGDEFARVVLRLSDERDNRRTDGHASVHGAYEEDRLHAGGRHS